VALDAFIDVWKLIQVVVGIANFSTVGRGIMGLSMMNLYKRLRQNAVIGKGDVKYEKRNAYCLYIRFCLVWLW